MFTFNRFKSVLKHCLLAVCMVVVPASWMAATAAEADEVAMASQPQTVNINEADAETLAQVLAGVGISRAESIVRYREEFGPFFTPEDLQQVRGIGPGVVEKNRDRIRLE